MSSRDSTAAIVLAAGESTRMGRLKQLLPWDDTTLVDWQVRQALEAGADDVVVVLGHAAETIRTAVSPPDTPYMRTVTPVAPTAGPSQCRAPPSTLISTTYSGTTIENVSPTVT